MWLFRLSSVALQSVKQARKQGQMLQIFFAITDSAITNSAVTDSAVTDSAVTDSAITENAINRYGNIFMRLMNFVGKINYNWLEPTVSRGGNEY